jgi:hypothetical protein
LLFFLPPLFVFLCFELYLRNINTLYSYKMNGALKNADSIQLLVLGNSHACYGVDPEKFDLYAYNLAQPNQSLYFDKRITLKHLDKLVNLRYVLISIDFHSLYFSSQGMRDQWSYYAYGIEYKNNITTASKLSCLLGYTPSVALSFLRKELLAGNAGHRLPVDLDKGGCVYQPKNNGWVYFVQTDSSEMRPDGYALRAGVFNNAVKNLKEKPEILSDLEDFIVRLQRNQITPILITPPSFRDFNNQLSRITRDQNKSDIFYLTQKYGIEYWDFMDMPLNMSNFYNCDHLNSVGAGRFSEALNSKLMHKIGEMPLASKE